MGKRQTMIVKVWGLVGVLVGGCGADPAPEDSAGTGDTSATSPTVSGDTATMPGPSSGSNGTTTASTSTAPTSSAETSATATTDPTDASSDGTETGPGDPVGVPRCGDPRLPPAAPSFAAPVQLQANDGTGGAAAGDLDGDGRDEFVAQIQFRIYDWDGAEWQSHQPLANLDGRGNRFAGDIELADIDNDDDLDIVVPDSDNSGTQGGVSWFENPGTLDGAWVEHEIASFDGQGEGNAVEHLSEMEVGDIDDDGYVDVVVRDISHGVWVMMQVGDGSWAPRKFIPVLPREGLELWDPDDDGRLDILLNGVWLQTPADPVTGDYVVHPIVGMEAWYAPDSSNPSVRDYASKVEAGDFDGDGLLDVAITNAEELASGSPGKPRGISIYVQPADLIGGAWTEVQLTTDHWAWHTLLVADFDFDGSLDVMSAISAVGTDNAGDEIALWLNDGSGGAFAGQTVSTEATVYQGALGDADGDGDCDVLAPDHFDSGPVRYFENTTVP